MSQIRKLGECGCISNDDKDILLVALKQRKDNLIRTYQERLLTDAKDRIEISLDNTEKMIGTIEKIPTC